MKTQLLKPFTILAFFILMLCTWHTEAQVVPIDIQERITNSDYIFEGEVIRADCYWNADKTFIFTSVTVDITKVFKGALHCGSVEVITEGGIKGDTSLDISHNLSLEKGEMGIYLCRQTNRELPLIDYYPETNPVKLDPKYDEQSFIKYYDDYVNHIAEDWQYNFDSLAQVYNVVELYAQLNYIDCYPHRSIFDVHEDRANTLDQSTINPNVTSQNSALSIETDTLHRLNIRYGNRHVTSGIPHRFEFDIQLNDDCDTCYFSAADLIVKYDPLVFGGNLGSNPATIITQTGVLINHPYNIQYFDVSPSALAIRINRNATFLPGDSLINLPADPNLVNTVHLSVEILDCNSSSAILDTVVYPSYFNYHWYNSAAINPSLDSMYNYSLIDHPIPLTFPSCLMHIDAISPSTVNGGILDSVTVTGMGFDSIRGNGNVFLRNADRGGSNYVPLDSMDYGTWSDTLIKFAVPSIIDSLNTGKTYTPGSGIIKVKKNAGQVEVSQDPLNIFYSVTNMFPEDPGPRAKFFVNLITQPGSSGYVFRTDTNFSHHSDRLSCLRSAIRDWVCLTDVNFKLGTDTTFSFNQNIAPAVGHNVNYILFDTIQNNTVLARTYQWKQTQRFLCQRAWAYEIDLVVNKLYMNTFAADTDNTHPILPGLHDLYQILLHELGHAHSLRHVNDSSAVMWYAETPNIGGIPANLRRVKLYNDNSAYGGGNYVVERSLTFDTTVCGDTASAISVLMPDTGSNCTTFVGIAPQPKHNAQFSLYPNPSSAFINLSCKLEKEAEVEIKIYDYLGRIVYMIPKKKQSSGTFVENISTQSFPDGFYIVKLSVNKFEYATKFIKQ